MGAHSVVGSVRGFAKGLVEETAFLKCNSAFNEHLLSAHGCARAVGCSPVGRAHNLALGGCRGKPLPNMG